MYLCPFIFSVGEWDPKDYFKCSRGLCQGDPLSPYFFVISTDLLYRLVRKAKTYGLIEGFVPKEGGPSIPLIQFADESLFLLEANLENIRNLRCLLLIMEVASGLRMNLSKTLLFPVGEVENIEELATTMGCDVGSFSGTYLSLPLGTNSSSKAIWNPIIERMEQRL